MPKHSEVVGEALGAVCTCTCRSAAHSTGGAFVVVLDALQHSGKISDALQHSEKTSGTWQHSAKDVLVCVHALQHCHGKSATVSFLLSHFFAAFVFLPGFSSSDLLRLHVEETQFPFHGGRFVSLLCSTAQLHRSLEATMACARGLSSSDNGHESHGKC